MSETIRVIDTGILSAAQNVAWDKALMKAREEDRIPDTIRFLRFRPSALVGYHQSVKDEIRTGYCRKHGIEINRRITGGGAIYFDEGQLGWELIFKRSSLARYRTMQEISTAICESAASALNALGIRAAFRPRNDIEVDGRKVSGTGGAFENNVVLFQGTLLLDFNIEHLIRALRIPVEKLGDRELASAKERVASVRDILGRNVPLCDVQKELACALAGLFGKKPLLGNPNDRERACAIDQLAETRSAEWIDPPDRAVGGEVRQIDTFSRSKGGLVRLSGRFDLKKQLLKQLLVTGDVFVSPRRFLYDMENALKETPVPKVIPTLAQFLESYRYETVALAAADFVTAVTKLLEKFGNLRHGLAVDDVNAVETLGAELTQVARDAEVILVPYCAKPLDCQYRNSDACDQCGKCSVGETYKMAEEVGMRVVSINNYENLLEVLENERRRGTTAFVGACCSAFFTKRHKAFANARMSCAIVDIDDTTCYELNEENLAYKGEYRRQTHLKTDVLKKVLSMKKEQGTINHDEEGKPLPTGTGPLSE